MVKRRKNSRKPAEELGQSTRDVSKTPFFTTLALNSRIPLALFSIFSLAGLAIIVYKSIKSYQSSKNDDTDPIVLNLIETHPHDEKAFTISSQGLLYHKGYLYESTGGYGVSSVRKVEIRTGQVLQRKDLPNNQFGEGLEVVDSRLYQLTWRSRKGWIYNLSNFQVLGRFPITTTTGQGWGITFNGSFFVVSDGSEYLHFWNKETFRLVGRLKVTTPEGKPVRLLNELEFYDHSQILANVWFSDMIARINLETGKVISWYNFSKYSLFSGKGEDVLNGIALSRENKCLYATGKLWKYLYELEI